MVINALVGAFCAVIIWGGYELASPWLLHHPRRLNPNQAALLSLIKWIGLYALLVCICLFVGSHLFGLNLFDRSSLVFTVILGLLISSIIVTLRNTSSQVATARELEQARSHSSLLALKAQLSPHTLFNALNAIAALIPENPQGAERAVEHLSRLLRRILDALEQESWTLDEEFGLVRDLLEVEHSRFGDRLSFELILPESDRGRSIPPLLLLPLVENSLKHGFRPKVGSCHLCLETSGSIIRLSDDGVGRDVSAPDGIGLRTVRQRLESVGGRLDWLEVPKGCALEVRLCP